MTLLKKLAWAAATLAVLGYAALCGLLYAKQRDLVYFPAGTRITADQTDFSLDRGTVVLRGWRLNPGKPKALLYFGGNAESLAPSRRALGEWFPDRTVYLVAYRGYGASDGTPSEAALFEDSLALFDQVAREHPGGVAVIGRSLGSGVASHLAGARPVERLALVTPFDSLASVAQAHYRWLPVRWLVKDRYDSQRYLAVYRGPVLVLRSGRDSVIPAANTDRLVAALPNAPQVVAFPQSTHDSLSAEPGYGQALGEFMR